MIHLILKRISHTPKATFGALLLNHVPFTLTLENPWLDNKVGKSCIPEGDYECQRVNSPRFGDTFEVTAVPGRTHILFHRGNTADDTAGCILVGEQFDEVSGKSGISHSGAGYGELMDLLEGVYRFRLSVVGPQG